MEYPQITSADYSVLSHEWQCPACHTGLVRIDGDQLWCATCYHLYSRQDGIWYLMNDQQDEIKRTFSDVYDQVRRAEGWGSEDQEYYRKLPYKDLTHRHSQIWKMRSRSWTLFIQRVLVPLERNRRRPLRIFDIGAGNGWASYRMAERGHMVCAIDIRDDDLDGIGTRHGLWKPVRVTRVLADMNHLPFPDGAADLVLYNASLHYANDYRATLEEGLRVLAGDGRLVVLDTPWYSSDVEGRKMLKENRDHYHRVYPMAISLPSFQGFLTEEKVHDMAKFLLVTGSVYHVRKGLKDKMKRIWRQLRGLREPASFPVLVLRHAVPYPLPGEFANSRIRNATVLRYLCLLFFKVYQWFVSRFFYNREHFEKVNGDWFLVRRHVFPPRLMRSGAWMAGMFLRSPALLSQAGKVLDIGTGSGVLALTASRFASDVIGVDNNPEAIRCAQINAERFGYNNVRFVEGDLFGPIPVRSEKFDCILCNPPWYRDRPADSLDGAWRSASFMERFVGQLRDHLNPDGYALLVLSDHGESEWLLDHLWKSGYGVEAVAHRDYVNEVLVLYKISRTRL